MKNSLQARLITLMVVGSVFLIAAFTAIQIYNQIQQTDEFNIYRAKQIALIAKDRLEEIFSQKDEIAEAHLSKAQKTFSDLLESHAIQGAAIFNKYGKVLIAKGNLATDATFDAIAFGKISNERNKTKWLFPFVDKKKNITNLFLLIQSENGYVAKLVIPLGNIQDALNKVYAPIFFTVVIVIIGNVLLATLLSGTLVAPVKLLNQATKDIAQGDLDKKVSIQTEDELEELADTFNYMTAELKKMKAKAENVNPLTKLPGNIVIQEEVEKRINNKSKFALIYCDLDNFKAFNDKYGVHAGDDAIMMTAEIFKEAVAKEGKEGDFIGHEGGDDFLLLTDPERAAKVAYYIIEEFDSRVRKLYSKEDLTKGHIIARSRETEELKKFPIMTISLAGVSNMQKEINTYSQLTNIAAEVKKAAKKIGDSNFILDRRIVDMGKDHRKP